MLNKKLFILPMLLLIGKLSFADQSHQMRIYVKSANGIPATDLSISTPKFDCGGDKYTFQPNTHGQYTPSGQGLFLATFDGPYGYLEECSLGDGGKNVFFDITGLTVNYTINGTKKTCYIKQNLGLNGGAVLGSASAVYLEAEREDENIPCEGGDGISTYSINGGNSGADGEIVILGGN